MIKIVTFGILTLLLASCGPEDDTVENNGQTTGKNGESGLMNAIKLKDLSAAQKDTLCDWTIETAPKTATECSGDKEDEPAITKEACIESIREFSGDENLGVDFFETCVTTYAENPCETDCEQLAKSF